MKSKQASEAIGWRHIDEYWDMKSAFRIYCISLVLLFIAWIAKLHFIFGGDYLFRTASTGIVFSLILQLIAVRAELVASSKGLMNLFRVNSVCLIIVYLGMMLKVAHLLNDQILKDLVLDFIGIPAIVLAALYSFIRSSVFIQATLQEKILVSKHIVLPWLMFIISFMLYGIFSLNLMYRYT